MDAKMRANFINSVAGGQKIPCPSCGTLNADGSRFCITCGTKLEGAGQEAPAANPQKRTCPSCNTLNDMDSLFCVSCGTKLDGAPADKATAEKKAAFNPVSASETKVEKKPEKKAVFNFVEPEVVEDNEPVSTFAEGLPAWDIVPPQIMVRRKAKR